MTYFLGAIGIAASFFLIKYRQVVGDAVGDPDWAQKVGGIYNVVIIVAVFIFFWSIAAMTGTMDVLFSPILGLFGKTGQGINKI